MSSLVMEAQDLLFLPVTSAAPGLAACVYDLKFPRAQHTREGVEKKKKGEEDSIHVVASHSTSMLISTMRAACTALEGNKKCYRDSKTTLAQGTCGFQMLTNDLESS